MFYDYCIECVSASTYAYVWTVLAVGSEKVSDGNRKCHDCESTVDGPCGEKLEGPGGISCLNAESTQCYKLIEYHEDNTFCKCR